MKYTFLAEDGGEVPLAHFTLTPPQEEIKVQTYIDRTDEYATGRMLPGHFSWERAEGEPEVAGGAMFRVIGEDGVIFRCRVVDPSGPCTGSVLDSCARDGEKRP